MSNLTDWVAAITSIVSAVISVKSASAAKVSAADAAKNIHHSAVHELVIECYQLIALGSRYTSLVNEFRSESLDLPSHFGNFGVNQNNPFDKDIAYIEMCTKEARSLIEKQPKLYAATGDDLNKMKLRIMSENEELNIHFQEIELCLENYRSLKQSR